MKKRLSYRFRLAIVVFSAIICVLPVLFIVLNSLMSADEAASRYTSRVTPVTALGLTDGNLHYVEATLIPDLLTLSGFRDILMHDPTNLRFLWNSLILAVPIVVGTLIISPMAAYAFERLRAKHKEKLFFAYIITMMLPMQALLVPHFIAANFLGITDNYLAIILPAIFAPFGVFLIRQQMKSFDKATIEAAKIDGANELQIFTSIVLPNLKPTMTALMVLSFSEVWNLVDQAVVFIREVRFMPLATQLSIAYSDGMISTVFAISTVFMIPALIVFIYGQDNLAEGVGYTSFR
ncbi:MAG: carbohydrate ABC transporter permease [Oscillospiraceae bacterium]|nr:carbohydrate ABC transporter permease [Oscillospiraceae bacterium]MCL2279608.1 carbohydrate ABC transporter permease [Oscillospiraceae bacterium]